MSSIEPVPFRLGVPGSDTFDSHGVHSITYKVEGLLHLTEEMVILEWTGSESTEKVALSGVGTDVKLLPFETLEIPVEWIAEARVRRRFLSSPRLELRARRLDAFDVVPSSRPGVVRLKIRRRDKELAARMVEAIYRVRAEVEEQLADAEDGTPLIEEGS